MVNLQTSVPVTRGIRHALGILILVSILVLYEYWVLLKLSKLCNTR